MLLQLSGKSNDKIKFAQKVASSSRFRHENNCFFLEGLRLCYDALLSSIEITELFFTQQAQLKSPEKMDSLVRYAKNAYIITQALADKLGETKTGQGIFAICKMPANTQSLKEKGKYVALENIQDPANLGAVVRTAEALGIDGVIVCGCCDVYNPKAQRAAMGSLLRANLIFTHDLPTFIQQNPNYKFLATTPSADARKITEIDVPERLVLIIGNEGNGITPQTMSMCHCVTIPMGGRAESLNASMAAAIAMWEITERGKQYG